MKYWKGALFLVCLAVCTLGVAGGRGGHKQRRNGHSKSFLANILSPTNNAAAAQYGVKIPPKNCLLTWEQFRRSVVGQDWLAIYSIDDDTDPITAYKAKLLWKVLPNGNIRRLATLWSDVGAGECLAADAEFARACPKLALFENTGEGLFTSPDRKDRFISCDPNKYVIFCICYVKEDRGRCPESECFLLVKDQRPFGDNKMREGDILLDGIPWTKIEYTFKRCIDQVFVDDTPPKLNWVWKFTECPHPKSEE